MDIVKQGNDFTIIASVQELCALYIAVGSYGGAAARDSESMVDCWKALSIAYNTHIKGEKG